MARKLFLPKADPAKAAAVEEIERGMAPKPEPVHIPNDASIDDLLVAGVRSIRMALISVGEEINTGAFSRDAIQNLKDLMVMLKDLKKEEKAALQSLTDKELEEMIEE
jgi:hypothetical protein